MYDTIDLQAARFEEEHNKKDTPLISTRTIADRLKHAKLVNEIAAKKGDDYENLLAYADKEYRKRSYQDSVTYGVENEHVIRTNRRGRSF